MLKKIAKIKNFKMYFVTFWCGKCQTGSVVTVQSQFECGTIKIKFLKPLSCYFTISTQQLKHQIFSLKASWRYMNINSFKYWTAIYLSKILHNIHIEAVIWHLDVSCNILVWKMSNWVCCDCWKSASYL
jgi:hypothetical protein